MPSLAHIPKIIEFLDCDPFEKIPDNLGEKIRENRRGHGLSRKKLAEQVEVDKTTLGDWEIGDHKPTKRLRGKFSATI
jgi:ribosome-binding protein aMBF1 (putative translation factor)